MTEPVPESLPKAERLFPIDRLAVLASGEGTTFQAVLDATRDGRLTAQIVGVVADRPDVGVLRRAEAAGIRTEVIDPGRFPDATDRDRAMAGTLLDMQAGLVLSAGYERLIGPSTVSTYEHRLLNTHPSLLPKYGGKGFHGDYVYEAVLGAGESETGITIHLVNERFDDGRILRQETVPVRPGDDVARLKARNQKAEKEFVISVLGEIVSGKLPLG